jgi:membrane fusion protein, multidrug efflux system
MTLVSTPPTSQTQGRRPSGVLRVIILLAMLAILVAGGYLIYRALSKKDAADTKAGRGAGGITITTATATKGDIGNYIKRIGNVVPVYTALIYPQITGVVKTVDFQEGQIVKIGDPLVEIDDSQYQAMLEQAQGTLARDQGVLDQAQMDADRYKDAWKLKAIAKQILDDQLMLVEQEKGTVKNDKGVVDYDQIQVNYCHITAPIAGRVGLRPVDPGNLVVPGASSNATPLAVITQLQPITVVFSIPEGNDNLGAVLAQLKNGVKLTADVYDSTDTKKLASGEFLALDSQIDTTTGTVKVRATFANDDMALFPNQFVNVHLLVETLKGVTLVPTATIQQNGQTSFFYVIKDNTAHVQNVTITPGTFDDKLGVTPVDGINPGDVVANSSFDKLQDGSKVSVESGKNPAGKGGSSPAPGVSPSPAAADASPSPAADASPSPATDANPSPTAHKHRGHADDSGS